MTLDLLDYWDTRAHAYGTSDVVGRQILKTYINRIKPRSLIEVGCGPGILFSLYRDVSRVTALDFSPTMLERARERDLRHGYGFELVHHDITQPFKGSWDLAVTRTCLMHINPDEIGDAVENISRICGQALIFEYWEPSPSKPLEGHNWLHDYTGLFEKTGFKSSEVYMRGDQPQAVFLFKKVKENG